MITTHTVTLEQTVRLLASTDAELLGAQPRTEIYGSLAIALIEFTTLVSSPQAKFWHAIPKLWRIYKDAKRKSQQVAGSLLAKSLTKFGGSGICSRIDYCKEKASLKELFDFADSPEGKAVFAKGVEAAMDTNYAKTIDKLREMLGKAADAIAEASKEVAEEVGDSVIPVAYVFMSIKYGLDELCMCCADCNGLGFVDNKECAKCGGNGHLRP